MSLSNVKWITLYTVSSGRNDKVPEVFSLRQLSKKKNKKISHYNPNVIRTADVYYIPVSNT